jgi:hypothetical protein
MKEQIIVKKWMYVLRKNVLISCLNRTQKPYTITIDTKRKQWTNIDLNNLKSLLLKPYKVSYEKQIEEL